MSSSPRVLVTGATGYVGGRLVPRLLDAGHPVRVAVRSPQKLQQVPWRERVEVHETDLADLEGMTAACRDVHTLYYLVHSMGGSQHFEEQEAGMARTVAAAAERAGVRRIVYLSGLHPEGVELSQHMRSRVQVGRILLESPVPAVVLQAGTVIGSGSASFEMIRHLGDTLPVMPAPSWVTNRIEPIAIRDVLHYLVGAMDLPEGLNRTFDIGSRDVLTYADAMRQYARVAGLRRRFVFRMPLPAPRLSGFWIGLVTPIPLGLALPLVQSLQHDAISAEHDIDAYLPPPAGGLTGYRRAVALALKKIEDNSVETTWDHRPEAAADPLPSDPDWAGRTVFVDERSRTGRARPEQVWRVIESIGGRNGWYSLPLAWRVRGAVDKLVGGAGLNRGRRDAVDLQVGEHVDWWRVEALEEGHRLLLHAEMKAPGRAWLELSVEPEGEGSRYRQRAIFFPRGLPGRLYWWGVWPFHGFIFPSMARNILATAAALDEPGPGAPRRAAERIAPAAGPPRA
ncbi:NAD(P)-dependent oxidoreductase [Kocuria flava]|uniref:NAD(P)-dependent oxidoreductase n=1 Tax=Kocuria flava TaxID=446860 RepID=A0A2N4SYS9_9MICC|nr:SDR family oxidoreductase [Kocuria flava]PLC11135.1 NAD(P)-dependent oxidoreductase [Kocuria flava]